MEGSVKYSMSEKDEMVMWAIDVITHALKSDTIVLDDYGVPVPDQEGYKKDVLIGIFELVGESL